MKTFTPDKETQLFNDLQEVGQERHPRSWYIANRMAVVCSTIDVKANRLAITNIVLRVLDAVDAP